MSALVSTELLKIRTTRSWWGMLIGLLVWASLWTLVPALTSGMEFAPGQVAPSTADDAVARGLYTTALTSFGFVFTLVLGILVISGEYRHQTVTPTFLATPRRYRVVIAKWLSSSVYAVVYGVLALALSIAVAVGILILRGQPLNLGADDLPRSLAFALLGFVLWALIGIGVGTLIGNQVVAILVGIGFVFVEFVATIALSFASWGPDVLKWFPSNATTAMLAPSTRQADGSVLEILPWWGGVAVLLAYALVSAGVGAALTLRRDVT
jgi:ABC-2 type transport system permease protein